MIAPMTHPANQPASDRGLLRVRHGHGHHRVTFVELFFDLVFVFAVTQLSHSLIEHFSMLGAHPDGVADARRLVDVDVHDVVDELARSRSAAGSRRALDADAARA